MAAIRDKMVKTLARTRPATTRPKIAPWENACRVFAGESGPGSPLSTTTRPRVTGSSVSGYRIFETAIEAGILITDEVIRFWGGTPRLIYASRTEPAMVEKPEVMAR